MDDHFRNKIFNRMIKLGILSKNDSILVVGGTKSERDYFFNLNFKNITISNISTENPKTIFPYKYVKQNMNRLTFPDYIFDYVFVSQSLHHCSSPVNALLEMYRVSKKGIIILEARDSLIMKIGQKIKLIPSYEYEAVINNNYSGGGMNNTEIPNYIYRWTEREIEKIIYSFNPIGKHKFIYFHQFRPTFKQSEIMNQKFKYYLLKILANIIKPFMYLVNREGNDFGIVIVKPRIPENLFPWLTFKNKKIVFNRNYKK